MQVDSINLDRENFHFNKLSKLNSVNNYVSIINYDVVNSPDIVYSSNNKYVLFKGHKFNWYQAGSFCASVFGTQVATIKDYYENEQIRELIENTFGIDNNIDNIDNNKDRISVWIGLNDINNNNDWEWIVNMTYNCDTCEPSSPPKITNQNNMNRINYLYRNWLPNKPDFNDEWTYDDGHDCAVITNNGYGEWNSISCYNYTYILCNNENNNNDASNSNSNAYGNNIINNLNFTYIAIILLFVGIITLLSIIGIYCIKNQLLFGYKKLDTICTIKDNEKQQINKNKNNIQTYV